MNSRRFQVGSRPGIAIRASSLALQANFKPLTCTFAPLAGLEPATYGLEVDPRPSTPSPRLQFLLLRSGTSSAWWHSVVPGIAWGNDQRTDRRRLPPTRLGTTGQLLRRASANRTLTNLPPSKPRRAPSQWPNGATTTRSWHPTGRPPALARSRHRGPRPGRRHPGGRPQRRSSRCADGSRRRVASPPPRPISLA